MYHIHAVSIGKPTTIPITNKQISCNPGFQRFFQGWSCSAQCWCHWYHQLWCLHLNKNEAKTTDFSSSSRWTIHGTISCLQRKTIILRKAITSITISVFAHAVLFFGVFRPPTSNGSFPVMRKISMPGMISDCQALQIFLSQGAPPDQQITTKKGAKSTLLLSFQVARRPTHTRTTIVHF